MVDHPELSLEMKIPGADVLKRLRAKAAKARGQDDALNKEIATAFNLPVTNVTGNLSDALAFLRAVVPDWTSFTMEGYADISSDDSGGFLPESYNLDIHAPVVSKPIEDITSPWPELAALGATLDYLLRRPTAEQKAAAAAAAKARRDAQPHEDDPENAEHLATMARLEAEKREREARTYPDGYEGHVLWHVDYMRDCATDGSAEMMVCGNQEVAKIIEGVFEEVARIMQGQLRAIQIVQEMMEAEAAKNPSPRMKALKAAIEAIYTT